MVQTPSRNYSVADFTEMFQTLGLNQTAALYQQLIAQNLTAAQLSPPSVPTHVMYSTGVDTELGYVYDQDFDASTDVAPKEIIKGDGDGKHCL